MTEVDQERLDEIEGQIYDHQRELIIGKYGSAEAAKANYGWGVDETDTGLVVETKVYDPSKILITRSEADADFAFYDSWRDYEPQTYTPHGYTP